MVEVFCDMCKRPGKAFLGVFKPKRWIKHKTPDKLELLFCSMACFERFKGVKLAPPSIKAREREVEKQPLVEVPVRS